MFKRTIQYAAAAMKLITVEYVNPRATAEWQGVHGPQSHMAGSTWTPEPQLNGRECMDPRATAEWQGVHGPQSHVHS